jgi:hypothetical protein
LSDLTGVDPAGVPAPYDNYLIRYWVDASSGFCGFCPDDVCGTPQSSCFFTTSGALINGVPTPVDWGCDGSLFDVGVISDINGNNSELDVHDPAGTNDWANLFYEFQCRSTYADFAPDQLAHAFPEQQYRDLGFDPLPAVVARLEVQPLCLDLGGDGMIPAVLFGSARLDVTKVDLKTLRLGSAPAVVESFSIDDLDGDGQPDLKGDFLLDRLRIKETDLLLHMTGSLRNGRAFVARDAIEPGPAD